VSLSEREIPFREEIVSEETVSLRRRCSCGSAILSLVGMSSVPKGFHIRARVGLRNVFVFQNCEKKVNTGEGFPLPAPKGGSVLKARASFS
jgi:hypothetical protein